MVFAFFFAISPQKCCRKIRFLSGLVFCLVLSVLGSGWRFSVRFCFFSSFFFFPLSSLGVGLGLFLFFPPPPLCLQVWRGRRRQVLRCIPSCHVFSFSSFLFSLPGPAPLSLPRLSLPLSLSLSLSLLSPSLSFSCMHACSLRNTPSTAGSSMTGSERPSPVPLLEREASPAVLGQ